jgi:hypothetical protein
LGDDFGMIWGRFWDDFGMIRDDFRMILGRFWIDLGMNVGIILI